MDNYIRLGVSIIAGAYVLWLEFRIMQLNRDVRVFKARKADEDITEKIHAMSASDLDNDLSKRLSGSGPKT